jgi:magnesium-transporting ATPase (P-type)
VLYAVLSTSVFAIPLPLLVVQVLAIDLAIDVIPSLALSREPPEAGIMQEPPRSIKERLFTPKVFSRSLYIGTIIAIGATYLCISTWMAGGWQFGQPLAANDPLYIKGITMTFAGIVVAQAGNVLACRTSKQSVFQSSLAKNKWIIWGITAQLSILAILVYVPFLQPIFGTSPLTAIDWLYLVGLALIVIVAEEIRKVFSRQFRVLFCRLNACCENSN